MFIKYFLNYTDENHTTVPSYLENTQVNSFLNI